jgi:hypothetical protein
MKVTIHQPEHMPWLGFFHKLNMADVYVVLDDVQYRKNYFQNRNKIRTANGQCWLSVPAKYKFGQHIKDVIIDNSNERWKRKYWESINLSYKKARFFNQYSEAIKSILDREWIYVSELNQRLILKCIEFLGINSVIFKSSELNVEGSGSTLILNICKKLKAEVYISGISGKDYLNILDFEEAAIDVIFQEFHHPIYNQLYKPFIPGMSVIDLLFNYGEKSLDVIKGFDVPVMEGVFL